MTRRAHHGVHRYPSSRRGVPITAGHDEACQSLRVPVPVVDAHGDRLPRQLRVLVPRKGPEAPPAPVVGVHAEASNDKVCADEGEVVPAGVAVVVFLALLRHLPPKLLGQDALHEAPQQPLLLLGAHHRLPPREGGRLPGPEGAAVGRAGPEGGGESLKQRRRRSRHPKRGRHFCPERCRSRRGGLEGGRDGAVPARDPSETRRGTPNGEQFPERGEGPGRCWVRDGDDVLVHAPLRVQRVLGDALDDELVGLVVGGLHPRAPLLLLQLGNLRLRNDPVPVAVQPAPDLPPGEAPRVELDPPSQLDLGTVRSVLVHQHHGHLRGAKQH
mmetsp:Transcript_27183/g.68990  ORF Transcript_27183/g.68990 Transcript_27183/m.68990 type:complete len:328 (+) Transcript_27183:691-1674(+)